MAETELKKSRGRPKTLDRARTLNLAMESYWDEGVHCISLNEICRRADVSKPGLYREFGGEDGLMVAVLDHYIATVFAPLVELIQSDRPFADVLHDVVEAITQDKDAPAGCMAAKMRSTASALGPLTKARLKRFHEECVEVYEGWIGRAQRREEVDPAIATELAASYLDTQLTTILTQVASGEDTLMIRAKAELAFRALKFT